MAKNYDVRFDGLEEVQDYMDGLGKDFHDEIEDTLREGVLYFQSHIPQYPTRPANSYVRTNTLGRSLTWVGQASFAGGNEWSISDITWMGSKLEALVGSSVPYAIYVIDEDFQAWMHEPYWWIIQEVFETNIPGIVQVFEERLNKFVNR